MCHPCILCRQSHYHILNIQSSIVKKSNDYINNRQRKNNYLRILCRHSHYRILNIQSSLKSIKNKTVKKDNMCHPRILCRHSHYRILNILTSFVKKSKEYINHRQGKNNYFRILCRHSHYRILNI